MKLWIKIAIFVLVLLLILIGFILIKGFNKGSKYCETDSDCIPHGFYGDCDCGCYNKDDIPGGLSSSGDGPCLCAPPERCMCFMNECMPYHDGVSNLTN